MAIDLRRRESELQKLEVANRIKSLTGREQENRQPLRYEHFQLFGEMKRFVFFSTDCA